MRETMIEMRGISKAFPGVQALRDCSLEVYQGEVHALLGENGAGKSTLIKILGGIYQPDTGMIRIDGKEVKMAGVQEAQETGIGIIHQEIVLVPYLSVSENIFLGRELKTKLGTKDMKAMNRQAKELLVDYWGSMIRKGADTFWEVYDPKDDFKSPYNFYPINSYCHAWSCTPVYFINKYKEIFQQ